VFCHRHFSQSYVHTVKQQCALASSQKQWRIVSTGSSVAEVRAAAMAGLALTPFARQWIRPGLHIVDKKDRMPKRPEVEFVSSLCYLTAQIR
jgi:DNA-binding transcriptional LysR family regulator